LNTVAGIVLTAIWTANAVLNLAFAGRVSLRARRVALSCAAGLTAGIVSAVVWSKPQPVLSDLFQVWGGARALLAGQDVYDAVGPGRAFDWPLPLFYPLTAAIAVVPLAWLPLHWADAIFVGVGFGLYAWAVTAVSLESPALVALVSLPALMTIQLSQWSVLLAGAAMVPALGFLLIAKPTVGLALFTAEPRLKTAIGCALLFALSIVLWPTWIFEWRLTFASAPHVVAPVVRPFGVLALVALAKWRRAEARLLVALACIPHTTALYEAIPLFLIPRTHLEAWLLWALAIAAYAAQAASGPFTSQLDYWNSGANWIVVTMYLPCLVMVLCRPNVYTSLLPTRNDDGGSVPALEPLRAS
jgi:hypothetical protein